MSDHEEDAPAAHRDAAEAEFPPVCDATREELLKPPSPLAFLSNCPVCNFRVRFHRPTYRDPVPGAAAAADADAAPVLSSSTKRNALNDLLKLADELPKWKYGKSNATTFLDDIELKLKACTTIPSSMYNRVFAHVMTDHYDSNWCNDNIIEPNLSWPEARKVFVNQFKNPARATELMDKLAKFQTGPNESTHRAGQRFTELCREIPLPDNDKFAIMTWKRGLKPQIYELYTRRQSILMDTVIMLPGAADLLGLPATAENEETAMDTAVPETSLQKTIRLCVKIELEQQKIQALSHSQSRSRDKDTDSGSSNHKSGHKKPDSSNKKQQQKKQKKSDDDADSNAGKEGYYYCKFHKRHVKHRSGECDLGKSQREANKNSKPPVKKESGGKPPLEDVTCFKCNRKGHYANSPDCPERHKQGKPSQAPPAQRPPAGGTNTQQRQQNLPLRGADVDDGDSKDVPLRTLDVPLSTIELPNGFMLPESAFTRIRAHVDIIFDGVVYPNALVDSGAKRTFIDKDLVDSKRLKVRPVKGNIKQALNGHSVPRYGRTGPLELTFTFPGDPENKQPMTLTQPLEVGPLQSEEYRFILGRDILRILFPKGIPPEYYDDDDDGDEEANGLDILCATAMVTDIGDIELATVAVEQRKDIADALAELEKHIHDAGCGDIPAVEQPSKVSAYTDQQSEAEFAQFRERILNDAEVKQVLATNSRLTGFCTIEGAVLELQVEPSQAATLYRKQYPIPERLRPLVDEVIARWHGAGKLEAAPPNCPHNNPILVVPKKDEHGNLTGIRVCLDVRAVNKALVRSSIDRFPIPYIRRVLDHFMGCHIFGELDLEEAYLQMELHPNSRLYTAFTWSGVQYMFRAVPFGIEVVPSWFQRLVSTHIGRFVPCTQPYFDNFPFGSKSWEEHRQHLLMLVRRLNECNLKVKPSSYKIGQSHLKCLGHVLSRRGVGVDPKKMEAIMSWPVPATGPQLQSFLGLAVFVRDHVRHFADITAPLESVKNRKQIEWTPQLLECFETTKRAIATAPFLKFADFTKSFTIATDASNSGIGGVLYQPDDADCTITAHNIVAICSKKLNDCQQRYSVYKKELFGIVYCLRQFHVYIWGRSDLVVYTDHKPLTHMKESPTLSQPLQQWFDVIQDYSFEIRHRPGILNVLPDALSRMYCDVYRGRAWGTASPTALSEAATSLVGEGTALAAITVESTPTYTTISDLDFPKDDSTLAQIMDEPPLDITLRAADLDLQVELEKRGKIAPAEASRRELIEREHAFGHFGREAIYKKLYNSGFWWPKMRDDIQSVIAECDKCARFTVVKRGFHPAAAITAEGPMCHLQLDTSVHLPPTPDGFTVLLVIMCVFTGFVFLRALKSKDAEEIARVLWDVCSLFGLPKIIQSDNGSEFVNDIIRCLVKLIGVDHRFISAYNARADGKVERAIGTVASIIKKMLHGTYKYWHLYVSFAQYTFNLKISSLTGSSPFSLMFARAPVELCDYTSVDIKPVSLDDWRAYQEKILSLIYPAIFERTGLSKDKMISRLNKIRKQLTPASIPAGSTVMLIDPHKSTKWEPKYVGPYIVNRRTHAGNYVLQYPDGDFLDRHATADQLKLVSKKPRKIDKDAPLFEVEKILEHRGEPGAYEYLVKWKGYGADDNSWEPASSFLDTKCIQQYWKAPMQPAPVSDEERAKRAPAAPSTPSITDQSSADSTKSTRPVRRSTRRRQ